jgi:prepilin-type N-terminal cleavage/methylation domain-containing protein
MKPHRCAPAARSRARETGFTLVELMMGIVVLSVSLLGMLGLVATSFGMSRSAHEMTQAKNGAMRKLEEIRELARTDFGLVVSRYGIGSESGFRDFAVGNLSPRPGDADGRPGRVTASPAGFGSNLLDVVVRVEWQGSGGARSFEMRSRVTGS